MDNPEASRTAIAPQLVEGVVDGVLDLLLRTLNDNLLVVQAQYPSSTSNPTLEPVTNYYVSEQYIGLVTPAVFVLATDSPHDLNQAANFIYAENRLIVAALIEQVGGDRAENRLTRKTWRYARALFMALHDQKIFPPYPTTTILVDAVKYSPVLPVTKGGQTFRKEAWLEIRAISREQFE